MAIKINPYIIFDFETGGFESPKHAVTEIAMMCVDGETFQEVGRYESYIKPYLMEYDQKSLDYTGLTLDKLERQGKTLAEVTKEVCEKMLEWKTLTSNTHTKKPILVGHNMKFDIGFLQQIFKQGRQELSRCVEGDKDYFGNFSPQGLDTQQLAKMTWGNDPSFTSFKLHLCMMKAGLEIADAHKAMNDVIATKELLIYFVNNLRNFTGGTQGSKVRVRDSFKFEY